MQKKSLTLLAKRVTLEPGRAGRKKGEEMLIAVKINEPDKRDLTRMIADASKLLAWMEDRESAANIKTVREATAPDKNPRPHWRQPPTDASYVHHAGYDNPDTDNPAPIILTEEKRDAPN
jgi:hypothetical protein